jgi:hypothetical protein
MKKKEIKQGKKLKINQVPSVILALVSYSLSGTGVRTLS